MKYKIDYTRYGEILAFMNLLKIDMQTVEGVMYVIDRDTKSLTLFKDFKKFGIVIPKHHTLFLWPGRWPVYTDKGLVEIEVKKNDPIYPKMIKEEVEVQ